MKGCQTEHDTDTGTKASFLFVSQSKTATAVLSREKWLRFVSFQKSELLSLFMALIRSVLATVLSTHG